MVFLPVLHRWLGLALAVIIVVVAASGGLLLLRDPYYRAVYPALRDPIRSTQVARRAAILTAIEWRWRTEGVRLVKFPRPDVNAFQVWLGDGTEAFVDPENGTTIDRWHWSERLPAFLFELHAHLLAERTGTVINGFAALCLVFMGVTGILLWWPARRGAFRIRRAIPRRATSSQLLRSHAAVGAIAVVPVLVFAATGAGLVFYEPAAHAMSALFDAHRPQEPDARVTPKGVPARPWTEILDVLDRTFPDGEAVFYYPGTLDNARLMFRKRLSGEWHPNGRSYVVIDPYTADLVQAIDARAQGGGTRFMHALYPIHSAKVGGAAMLAIAAVAPVALTWLATSGIWAYVARRAVVIRQRHTAAQEASRVFCGLRESAPRASHADASVPAEIPPGARDGEGT